MSNHNQFDLPSGNGDTVKDMQSRKTASQWIMGIFDRFASHITKWAGSPAAFSLAFALICVWGVSGPFFHYSETWQLVVNTGTTIVTFLMVFLIQRSQNKDCQAVHVKLDELIRSMKGARNEIIDAENLPDEDLQHLGRQFQTHRTDT